MFRTRTPADAYRASVRMTCVLGACSIIASIAAYRALSHIGHGAVETTVDWAVLRGCILVFMLFIASAIVTTLHIVRRYVRSVV
jgi:hypothetical protein